MGQSTENEKLSEIKLVERAKTDNQAFEEHTFETISSVSSRWLVLLRI